MSAPAMKANGLALRKAAAKRKERREAYRARVAAGVCPRCPPDDMKPPRAGRVLCAKCGEANNAHARRIDKKKRNAHIVLGLCSVCHTAEPMPRRRLCGACAEKREEVTVRRAKRLNAAGLCRRCGKGPLVGTMYCRGCQDKVNATVGKWSKKERLRRLAAGLCGACGDHPHRPGRTTCSACAQVQTERTAAYRARKQARQAMGEAA